MHIFLILTYLHYQCTHCWYIMSHKNKITKKLISFWHFLLQNNVIKLTCTKSKQELKKWILESNVISLTIKRNNGVNKILHSPGWKSLYVKTFLEQMWQISFLISPICCLLTCVDSKPWSDRDARVLGHNKLRHSIGPIFKGLLGANTLLNCKVTAKCITVIKT